MLGSLIIKRTTPKALRTLRCENNTKGIDYQKAKNTKSYIRFIDKTQEFTGNTKTKSKDHLQCTKTTCRLDIYLHSPYFLMQNFASMGEKTYLSFARFLFCLKTFHQILREKSIKLPYLDLNSLACHQNILEGFQTFVAYLCDLESNLVQTLCGWLIVNPPTSQN